MTCDMGAGNGIGGNQRHMGVARATLAGLSRDAQNVL